MAILSHMHPIHLCFAGPAHKGGTGRTSHRRDCNFHGLPRAAPSQRGWATGLVRSWARRSNRKYPSQVPPPVFGGHVIFNTIQDLERHGVTLSVA
jgi:hypothetical protein